MAHFVKLDENNIVIDNIVINNEIINEPEIGFPETEKLGIEFLHSIGLQGNWKQTSYNSSFRKQYACLGDKYNEDLDMFIKPKEYISWTLNDDGDWIAPVPIPNEILLENMRWKWNEENQEWVQFLQLDNLKNPNIEDPLFS